MNKRVDLDRDSFEPIGAIAVGVGCAKRARAANVLVTGVRPDHPHFRDKTGLRFGKLTVIDYAGRIGRSHAYRCLCDCGGSIVTRGYSLSAAATKSCGCLIDEKAGRAQYRHGLTDTDEFRILNGIKNRCYNKNVKSYPRYGGRGINVCNRWLHGEDGKSSIECFIDDVGRRPSKSHSVDRHPNPDGNYEPGNVRWATAREQEENKSGKRILTFGGKSQNVHEWARETGIPVKEITRRFLRGWPVEKTLTQQLRRSLTR